MKILFCWPGVNGYMAACWRALIARGVEVRIIALHPRHLTDSPFQTQVMSGIPHRLIDATPEATELCVREILDFAPDVVYLPSWGYPVFNALAYRRELANCRFIMGMDNPWRGTWRQRLGRLRVWRYLARMDKVLVPGERSFYFARRLGVPEARIARCALYGIDYAGLAVLHRQRRQWPRQFLFIGRYVPDKGIDLLVEAHQRYRERNWASSWPLVCCGDGPLRHLLARSSITDLGFVQPAGLLDVWRTAGALVHPARLDHWPLVLIEAQAAGLPVIASEACGSVVETVRPFYNGLTIPTADVGALAEAMAWVEAHYPLLPMMGERAQQAAAPFAAAAWADRMVHVLSDKPLSQQGLSHTILRIAETINA